MANVNHQEMWGNVLTRWGTRLRHNVAVWRSLGLMGTVKYRTYPVGTRFFGAEGTVSLTSKYAEHPLKCRPGTSDRSAFSQIFIDKEYGALDDARDVGLVIDCGANVGYASAYFLSRFPGCQLIAVEPEPSNFAMLGANLAPYGGRARAVHSGVWSHAVGLKISEVKYGDGREWATQVRETRADETPDMKAVDIGTLFKSSGRDRISILKMDIEGAEAVVFAANYDSWLPYTDNIVIELHDDTFFGKASDTFFNAIANKGFKISRSGELTVCRASG